MSDLVGYEQHDAVAVVTIDNPPLNVLGPGVPEGIVAGIERADADDGVAATVLIGGGEHFSAGADIRTFSMPRDGAPDVRGMIARVDRSVKPVVAALTGSALGGGLETALASTWRVAGPRTSLGTPEVKLGLLPGAGGTQRLPRLVGITAALDMITTGRPIGASRAAELGLVDAIIEGDLRDGAIAFAAARAADGGTLRRTRDLDVTSDAPVEQVLAHARETAGARARGMIAPLRCIDAVEAAVTLPFDQGLQRERELFTELLASDQSRALQHVFFAERAAARIDDISDDVAPRDIDRSVVIGAGTMGGGIAMNFANAGIDVAVVEVDRDRLVAGLAKVERAYRASVDRGRLRADVMRERMDRITGVVDYDVVTGADVVIEAVFEDMDVKKQVFAELDERATADAVLATNTSTLDVDEIARATSRPSSVVGMHFFSPANVMKLLEVVRGERTADEALVTAVALGRKMGKIPVVVGVCNGFVGNRMFHAYTREAAFLLEEGALPQQVDAVMTDFGFAMGPFAVSDLAGLDIGYRIRTARAATRDPDERYSAIPDRIVEMDRLGQKSGAGFYRYPEGGRTPRPDPEIAQLIIAHSAELGIERREISADEVFERLLYQLVNEGARILAEGIAQRSGDIDVIYVHGYGFPAHAGGPMFHAGLIGLDNVLMATRRYHEQHGDRWTPAPLLAELAEQGKTFAQRDWRPGSA